MNPLAGLAHMLAQPFELRALLAGGAVAAAAGLVGWFLVLRAQVFTGDALSHVASTGALAALAAGVDLRVGLFVACVAVGVAMAGLGPAGRADDVVIGNLFAWVLGLGAFFLTLYTRGAGGGGAGVSVLFGSIFGLSSAQAVLAAAVAAGLAVAVVALGRPLLFASLDPAVAAARGVPVRLLGLGFLALVGVAAGEATQAVGSLLILGMLATPAATAARLVTRPWAGLALSAGLAVASVWLGLGLAYADSSLPPSFAIMAVATAGYLGAVLAGRRRNGGRAPRR